MKILVLANFGMGLYNFRKELLEEFIKQNHDVYISLPKDKYVSKLVEIGCNFVDTQVDRRGTNPFKDFKLLLNYVKIIKKIKPDVVLTYTIKPNVYGGIASTITKTPYITNITGLGTSVENKGIVQRIGMFLYKIGLKKASCVFFQNKTNQNYFVNNAIYKGKIKHIPGSGVNLDQYSYEEYPYSDEIIKFLFIGRIMKAKGIEELLDATKLVKKQYPNVQFHLIGGCEEDYAEKLDEFERLGIIKYHGQQNDVRTFLKESHATILPSYHEGLANVLLETASTGRPVLASKVPGCIETFEDGLTGLGFEVKSFESLANTIIDFIKLPYEQKRKMGIAARKKMENEFDRKLVIDAYLQEIKTITTKENYDESI